MNVDLFDFALPEERIALRPARPRDAARLLVVKPGEVFEDRVVRDLPTLLRPGDALVVNDTKVIPAELRGERARDGVSARVLATLIKRLDPSLNSTVVSSAEVQSPTSILVGKSAISHNVAS